MDLTPEQKVDVEARAKLFKDEYMALVDKHQIDFTAHPHLIPSQAGGFSIQAMLSVYDKKYLPVKSPLSN